MHGNMKATKTQALLEEAREKLGSVTDYKLGKVLQIHQQTISRYHEGTQQADAYACARLAMILNRDPLEIIAEVEADSAKTEARREFWAGFPSGLRRTALGAALFLTFGSSGVGWPGGAEAGSTSHNVGFRSRKKRTGRKAGHVLCKIPRYHRDGSLGLWPDTRSRQPNA